MTDFNVDTEDNPLDALAAEVHDTDTTSPEAETSTAPGQGSSDATDAPSAVQPEGQGQPDAETGLFNEYLSTVPEEHRSTVEQYLKDAERNVNGKLQEAAEAAKTWEPFGELGLQDVGAEGIGALLEFAQDLSNPETAADAIKAIAQAAGVDFSDAAGQSADGADPDEHDVPLTRAEFQAWQQQERAQQEQARLTAEARQHAEVGLRREYAEVEALHGKPFSTERVNGEPSESERVIALAKRFQSDHDEPIKAAYQWMQSIRGQAEADLVNSQPTPPGPSERGGRASSSIEPVDNFDDAERIHKERNSVHA